MNEELELLRKQLIDAGKYMRANELSWGNAGNISVRVRSESCLITASGTNLGDLVEDDLVVCGWGAETTAQTGRKPSKEVPMHRAFYERRPEVKAVLHASPFFST